MMKFRAILSPSDRFSEILFGLIMVLTITGTVGLGTSSKKAVLSSGIGACIAWEGCDLRKIKEELKDTIVDTLGES